MNILIYLRFVFDTVAVFVVQTYESGKFYFV